MGRLDERRRDHRPERDEEKEERKEETKSRQFLVLFSDLPPHFTTHY